MTIFVFGSNLAGIHGAGAAKEAFKDWGAIWGQPSGPMGRAYAIPTKDEKLRPLPLHSIKVHADLFVLYATTMPKVHFLLTEVGCGLAGYRVDQIAPMFKDAPDNVVMTGNFYDAILPYRGAQ